MKGKKKGLSVLLSLVLIVSIIAGCSRQDVNPEKDTKSLREMDQSVSEKEDDSLQLTGATDGKKSKNNKENSTKTKNYDSLESKGTLSSSYEPKYRYFEDCKGVTIEKQLLVDQNGVVITALKYVYNFSGEEGIKLSVTNNTDRTITVEGDTNIVNNYMVWGYFEEEIAAGKTVKSVFEIDGYDLDKSFIGIVEQVELAFEVYDTSTYEDILTTDFIKIQTSAYKGLDESSIPEGLELYNEGGIKIIGMYVDPEGIYGAEVLLRVENSSDKNIDVEVVKVMVNGVEMKAWYTGLVHAGKKEIGVLGLNNMRTEGNIIEKVEEVEVQFEILDSDTKDIIGHSDLVKFNVD